MLTSIANRTTFLRALCLTGLPVFVCGCFHPGMYQRSPYGQPMYAPQQNLNPGYGAPAYGAPGSLVIPESSGQPYVPNGGSTYDQDPGDDDFRRSDGPFYGTEDEVPEGDRVPLPNGSGGGNFMEDDDLGRPTTQLIPTDDGGQNSVARPVAYETSEGDTMPPEFGFDRADYRWLQGLLHYDPNLRAYVVEYSLAADDTFGGALRLKVDPALVKARGLRDGHPVEVRGHIEQPNSGNAVYHVEAIRRLATRVAM